MISNIKLQNFKSFINTSINFSNLTVLTGINASGKSSVIQGILMVYNSFINERDEYFNEINMQNLKSKLSKESFFAIEYTENPSNFKISYVYNDVTPEVKKEKNTDAVPNIISYLSAGRLGPQNQLPFYQLLFNKQTVGKDGKYVLAFIEKHENDIVCEKLRLNKESMTLRDSLNDWLSCISPNSQLSYDNKNQTLGVYFPSYNGILPTETGLGLSFTLPVLALLLYSGNDNEIVIIENPEAHLHPAAQTKLGELIALAASTGKQIIIETHSDHIIDGIRIAVKYNNIEAKKIMFHFFHRDGFDKETTIETPELYQDGKLAYWPEGFFDQSLKDKAILARKLNV